jgi:3'-phosphoadenosine 5'-phosphosulfate sulfotransferase (PAPS reductase)/FAD synthetase
MAIRLVSISGGKDSTATLLVALERHPKDEVRAVFADTGNEHPATYDYVRYLEGKLDLKITCLKRDFSEWWWRRRDYIRDKWPEKGVDPATIERALSAFDNGPTGNPYLDLCMIKGRFPSRMAQFCTQFLKTEPLNEYAIDLVDNHPDDELESWQGVRAEESARRALLAEREDKGDFTVYRPILKWNVEQVFAQHRKHGVEPNPLYKMGMGRVGCMPCINANKNEIAEIAARFPDQMDRIAEWEALVSTGSKRGNTSFFPSHDNDNRGVLMGRGIRDVIEWAKTSRGGKQYDIFKSDIEPLACSSAYGLCE